MAKQRVYNLLLECVTFGATGSQFSGVVQVVRMSRLGLPGRWREGGQTRHHLGRGGQSYQARFRKEVGRLIPGEGQMSEQRSYNPLLECATFGATGKPFHWCRAGG